MHFNFPIFIILFPLFHNFLSGGYMSGVIVQRVYVRGYMPRGICPGVYARGICPGVYARGICPGVFVKFFLSSFFLS